MFFSEKAPVRISAVMYMLWLLYYKVYMLYGIKFRILSVY